MVKPLTVVDIANFLEKVLYAFDDFIFFSFTLMIAFAVAMGIRHLLTWGS